MSSPASAPSRPPFIAKELDPRLTPARADLAAAWLKGKVEAPRYVEPVRQHITVPVASLHRTAQEGAIETQLLYGEDVDVLHSADGWAWVQSVTDGYVGYMRDTALAPQQGAAPTHRVSNIGSFMFAQANYKDMPLAALSYGSLLQVTGESDGLSEITGGFYVPTAHLAPLDFHSEEPVAEAFRFLGVPYLWGGRSHTGIDCSALVQLVLQACNIACPRDSDLQEKYLGKPVDRDDVQSGDLVFFRGHIGLMVDDSTMIHANDRAMAVSIDDLDEYVRWRTRNGKTPVKMFKRL